MLAAKEEREGSDMSEQMITFDQGRARFNLRVAGVALDSGRVLVHRGERDNFWTLPGGRGELLESSRAALKREMQAELGAEVDVGRLLWIAENFFEHEEMSYHELGLFFLISLPQRSRLRTLDAFEGKELLSGGETLKLLFKWFPVGELDGIPLYPTFLRQGLRSLPQAPEHIVHEDSK